MKKYIKIFLLLLISFGLKAQTPLPAGLPSPRSTSWYEIGWMQTDSGFINAVRSTGGFTPRFVGTQVFQIRAGVDTLPWWWTGQRWITFPTSGGGGGGNFNSFSFTNQNGITGTVTGATGPNVALALGTNLNGIVKANGSGFGTVVVGSGLTYDGTTLSAGTNINALISGNGTNFIATTIGAGLSYNTSSHTLTNTIINNNQLINGAGYLTNITGLVTAGANITVAGNGTAGTPYVISTSGGGTITGVGNLSPLFTTSVTSGTINFAFQNPSAFQIFGNPQGISTTPQYFGINSTLLFSGNLLGVNPAAPLNFYQTISQIDSFTFTLNTPTGRHDTVRISLPTNGFISLLNNGLTQTGSLGQLGGPLVQNTVINGGGFSLGIQGNRFATGMGAAIAAANNLTTGSDGNLFSVTGLTQINAIATTNWQPGAEIAFIFTSTPVLKNNTIGGGGTAPMLLAGSIDYQAAPGDYIKLQYDGSFWHEVTRKLTSAGGAYIFSNGITESPATRVKLGGTLTQNTTLAGAATFYLAINSGRFEVGQGAAVAAANNLVPGNDGNLFSITGNTQINALSTLNFQAGTHIEFVFTGTPTLKNNTAGGVNTAPMLLAGSIDYTAAAGDLIGFTYDGTVWHETNRKLAGSVSSGVSTANNGLNLSTPTNVQLGGLLVVSTTIDANTQPFIITGTRSVSTLNVTNTGSGPAILANGPNGASAIRAFTTGATAIYGQTDNGSGVAGVATANGGIGVFGQATSGNSSIGVNALAAGGGAVAGSFTNGDATTNTVITNSQFLRTSTSTAANGIGQSIDLILQTSNGQINTSNQIITKWTDATTATRTSQFSLTGVTNAVTSTWMSVDGTGVTSNGTVTGFTATSGTAGAILTGSVTGALIQSGSVPIQAINTSTSTNTIQQILRLSRQASYTGAAGVGGKIVWDMNNGSGSNITTSEVSNKLTTVTAGSEVSQFDFNVLSGTGSLSTKFSIGGVSTFVTATRFEVAQGAVVASTGNLTLGTDGNVFHISGTTTINAITTANWQPGSEIILIFNASVTVKNNTAGGGGTATMKLAGGIDFSATADDVLTLVWDGNNFFEKCRSVN